MTDPACRTYGLGGAWSRSAAVVRRSTSRSRNASCRSVASCWRGVPADAGNRPCKPVFGAATGAACGRAAPVLLDLTSANSVATRAASASCRRSCSSGSTAGPVAGRQALVHRDVGRTEPDARVRLETAGRAVGLMRSRAANPKAPPPLGPVPSRRVLRPIARIGTLQGDDQDRPDAQPAAMARTVIALRERRMTRGGRGAVGAPWRYPVRSAAALRSGRPVVDLRFRSWLTVLICTPGRTTRSSRCAERRTPSVRTIRTTRWRSPRRSSAAANSRSTII